MERAENLENPFRLRQPVLPDSPGYTEQGSPLRPLFQSIPSSLQGLNNSGTAINSNHQACFWPRNTAGTNAAT